MAKKFSKKKSRTGSYRSKTPDVKLEDSIFFWRQPLPATVTPWISLWPSGETFDAYIDPFLGSGFGWSKANSTALEFYINDIDYEYICVVKTIARGNSNLKIWLREWVRILGLMYSWPASYIKVWYSFHNDQVSHKWSDTATLKFRMSDLMTLTLKKLIDIHSKEFPIHIGYFENALRASLVAVFKKCYSLAQENGGKLPPERFILELKKAMKYAAFMYAQHFYSISLKENNFMDPQHTLAYIILHSIAKKDSTKKWKINPEISFDKYERLVYSLESPLIHNLGLQTQFSHSDAVRFLQKTPQHNRVFAFIDTPKNYPLSNFKTLYDLTFSKGILFLILAPKKMIDSVGHLQVKKTWMKDGEEWAALNNYNNIENNDIISISNIEDEFPDFSNENDFPIFNF